MSGRAILDVTPELLLASLRDMGLDLPIGVTVIGARLDPFAGGHVQLVLLGEGLPACAEGEIPVIITGQPQHRGAERLNCPECGSLMADARGDTYRCIKGHQYTLTDCVDLEKGRKKRTLNDRLVCAECEGYGRYGGCVTCGQTAFR